MDLLSLVKKTKKYNDLYAVPFDLKINKSVDISNVKIVLFVNACYGHGDKVFCYKIYDYIKEWYNIECTIMTSTPEYFIQNGVKNIFGIKIPGIKYVECANIKNMKIYNIDIKTGKFLNKINLKKKFDLIFVTPWIGTDYDPNHNVMKKFFSYSNRFNTFLFSPYNPSQPYKYDFPTGIGKNFLGVLIKEKYLSDSYTSDIVMLHPYIMVHISYYYSSDANGCYNRFVKFMCKKYYQIHPQLDIITPKFLLDEPKKMQQLIKYIKDNNYYDEVEIITTNQKINTNLSSNKRVLRIRTELLPLPFKQYISLFKNCLPDVLLTGNQSVTDIISCCKNYNIYYQIMPWERNFARNLNNTLKAPNDYLKNVRTACGYEKLSTNMKLNLLRIQDKYDFRILGRKKLDKLVYNIKNINENKDIKKYINIVLTSKKKSTVINKIKSEFNL